MSTLHVRARRTVALFSGCLRSPHPDERARGAEFEEEARSERLSNLVRIAFTAVWTVSALYHASSGATVSDRVNIGMGMLWLLFAAAYHVRLCRKPYRPSLVFAITTLDMAMATGILAAHAVVAGPVFALKMPYHLNYVCALGLAVFRFRRRFALYAGALAVGLSATVWIWLELRVGVPYGDRFQHVYSREVNPGVLFAHVLYLVMFTFLVAVAVANVRRQVRLRVRAAEASARNQERALLSAGLAHEIRNPLGSIYSAAQLLCEEGRSDPRLTEIILAEARRLNGVAEEFLRFARPFPVRPEEVDLVRLVGALCAAQRHLSPKESVEFLSGPESLVLRTDPEAVRQILLNLVENARRHQREGRPVRVRLAGNPEEALLSVEDDGPGVPEEMRERLFGPFQTASDGGSGLGLALSRKIAHEIGGELSYRPLHPGAQFVLLLHPMTKER